MKKLIVIVMLLLALPLTAKTFVPTNSIQPIQRINDDGVNVNVCTAFSINKDKGYWITANHCWHETNTFHNLPQTWVAYNEKLDLMVFQSYKAESLKLAIKAPDVGDDVYLIGYPHGSLDLLTFFGKLSSGKARTLNNQPEFNTQVFNILALPGNSGAPILDKSGRVVGIGQISSQNGVAWGTSWQALKDNTKEYWDN